MSRHQSKPDEFREAFRHARTREDVVDVAVAIDHELATIREWLRTPNLSNTQRDRARKERAAIASIKRDVANKLRELKPETTRSLDYRVIAYAIWEHKRAAEAANLEPEPHDTALWATLEHIDHVFITPQQTEPQTPNPA